MPGGMGHPQRTREKQQQSCFRTGQDMVGQITWDPCPLRPSCPCAGLPPSPGVGKPRISYPCPNRKCLSLSATEGTASKPPWAWPAVSYAKLQPLPINKEKKKKMLFLIHGKLPKWPFLLPEPAHLRGCSVWLCISKQQLHPQDSFIPHTVPSCPSPSTQGDKALARA